MSPLPPARVSHAFPAMRARNSFASFRSPRSVGNRWVAVRTPPSQRDKRFLDNRGLYVEGQTWLYKVSDVQGQELKVGGPQDSPTVEALCYEPFNGEQPCPQPDLATDVPQHVDMKGILTLLASDAFQANPDAILSNGKNFYFADFIGRTRMYFPWDRDSSLPGGGVNSSIYGEPATTHR